MNWKYAPKPTLESPDVVYRTNENGNMESCFVSRPDVQEWIAEGNIPEAADE